MIPLLSGIHSTAAALNAERVRMEVVSQNIANANTTHAQDGKPYRRQQVVFETELNRAMGTSPSAAAQSVKVSRIEADNRPAKLIYEPGHPDANAQGMVAVPDINVHEEMVDLIASSRSYEANIAVVKNARTMAMQALSIGKR
jgi:flagellar basal-body rod protein FlgC